MAMGQVSAERCKSVKLNLPSLEFSFLVITDIMIHLEKMSQKSLSLNNTPTLKEER